MSGFGKGGGCGGSSRGCAIHRPSPLGSPVGTAGHCELHATARVPMSRYNEAIQQYTAAISLNPNNPIYYNNRAMAYLKVFSFDPAEADADRALSFREGLSQADQVKALLRRGTARVHQYRVRFFQAAVARCPGWCGRHGRWTGRPVCLRGPARRDRLLPPFDAIPACQVHDAPPLLTVRLSVRLLCCRPVSPSLGRLPESSAAGAQQPAGARRG